MSQKKLTKRQAAVIEELFSGVDEAEVLEKFNVARVTFDRWLAEPVFVAGLDGRMAHSYRRSEMILSRYAPTAAAKLVELTQSDKPETARKACLDIISMFTTASDEPAEADAEQPIETPNLSPQTAARLLATLAASE